MNGVAFSTGSWRKRLFRFTSENELYVVGVQISTDSNSLFDVKGMESPVKTREGFV